MALPNNPVRYGHTKYIQRYIQANTGTINLIIIRISIIFLEPKRKSIEIF